MKNNIKDYIKEQMSFFKKMACAFDKHDSDKRKIRKDTLEEAAMICEKMVVGGRQWTKEQEIASEALFAAADNIRKLKKV